MRDQLREDDLPDDGSSGNVKGVGHADKLRVDAFDPLPDADRDGGKCRDADRHDRCEIIQAEPEQANDAVHNRGYCQPDHHPDVEKELCLAGKSHRGSDRGSQNHGEAQSEGHAEQGLVDMVKGLPGLQVLPHRFKDRPGAGNNRRRQQHRQDQPQKDEGGDGENLRDCTHRE